MSAEIKFEYGNRQFHTAQLIVHAAELSEAGVLVKLRSVHTDCKAKDACGVETEMDKASCCSPEADCC